MIRGLEATRRYVGFVRDPVACMRGIFEKYGELAALFPISPKRAPDRFEIMCVGPELCRQVLSDPTLFRTTGETLRGPEDSAQNRLRFGLTRMQGTQHKQQRQLVMPAFHRKAVEGYHRIMVETAGSVLSEWQVDTVSDIYSQMRNFALRLASSVLFSQDLHESLRAGTMIEEWLRKNFSSSVWLFPVNLPGTPYWQMLQHAGRLEKLILAMIAQRRAQPEGRTDVLAILTQARDEQGNAATDAELVGQATILFFASFETTASTMSWTLFLLAQHPEIFSDLTDELQSVLRGEPPTGDQLAQLPLLERVIKESMRILPPVPYTVRALMRKINMGGYRIRQGSRVVCSYYMTHHLPDLYPEPEKFRPERWLKFDPSPYEYMPFGAGPRSCIGGIFAMQAMKISLAMILQRFRLQVVPGSRIDRAVRVTMNPRHGIPMKIGGPGSQLSRSAVRGNIHDMVDMA